MNYPDVKQAFHYIYSSNFESLLEDGILIGPDLAKLVNKTWKRRYQKQDDEGRSEVYFTLVMDDGKRVPNFVDPEVTPRGVSLEPYLQGLGDKDMIVVVDVGAAEANGCRFMQMESFAVVSRSSVPQPTFLRIYQWKNLDGTPNWQ